MRHIKSTCLALLVMSLVFSAFPVPVLAAAEERAARSRAT